MNRSLAIRHLWWKEFQQLWPLVGLLLLLGLVLQLLAMLLPFGSQSAWSHSAALLGMPGLFAAGVGALLVGQEKELRTLDWLRSLPLAANDLVRTKLLVGLLGLAVVWAVSFGIGGVTGSLGLVFSSAGGEYLWPMHTLFLLLAGFACAWYFQSSLISLLVVVPVACLPLMLATLNQALIEWRLRLLQVEPEPWLMAVYLGVCSLVALGLSLKFAGAYLAPQNPPIHSSESNARALIRSRNFSYARTSPTPALLWQFAAQNQAALIGLTGFLWLAVLAGYWCGTHGYEVIVIWLFIGSFLAISWLGLLVFQGDVQQRRVMFLADRGVSPKLTWLTRQAIPLAVISVAWLLCIVMSYALREQLGIDFGTAGFGILAAVGFGSYFTAQWVGQLIRSPIVAAILTPFAASGMVAYNFYAAQDLGASGWVLCLAILIAPLATFWMTRRWMDHRTGWSFWLSHGGLLLVALIMPASNLLAYIATYPRMSAATKVAMDQIRSQSPSIAHRPLVQLPMPLGKPSETETQDATQVDGGHVGYEQYYAAIRQQMAQDPLAVCNPQVLDQCVWDSLVMRMRDVDATDPESLARYRQAVDVLAQNQLRLRGSLNLAEQDEGDIIEIRLLEELKAPLAKTRLGDELYRQLIAILSDLEAQRNARKIAVVASWDANRKSSTQVTLGGYAIHTGNRQRVTTRDVWDASRKAGLVCELLLKAADASGSELTEIRSEVYRLLGVGQLANGDLAFLETPNSAPQLLYSELKYRRLPGMFWNRSWEREAAELTTRLSAALGSEVQE